MKGFLICYNKNKEEIYKRALIKLPIKREEIVRRSIKEYSEEEPCIIYETAIINKIGLDIMYDVEKYNKYNIVYDISEISSIVGDILNLPSETSYIKFI